MWGSPLTLGYAVCMSLADWKKTHFTTVLQSANDECVVKKMKHHSNSVRSLGKLHDYWAAECRGATCCSMVCLCVCWTKSWALQKQLTGRDAIWVTSVGVIQPFVKITVAFFWTNMRCFHELARMLQANWWDGVEVTTRAFQFGQKKFRFDSRYGIDFFDLAIW